tara:strand:- start:621 stop:761 length:141 start_codon:yes stop_codon:yes gene_type:complete
MPTISKRKTLIKITNDGSEIKYKLPNDPIKLKKLQQERNKLKSMIR